MTTWRRSSFSSDQGNCVELAETDDRVLVRNSNRPAAGTLDLDRAALGAFVAGCAAGELDDHSVQRLMQRTGDKPRQTTTDDD